MMKKMVKMMKMKSVSNWLVVVAVVSLGAAAITRGRMDRQYDEFLASIPVQTGEKILAQSDKGILYHDPVLDRVIFREK